MEKFEELGLGHQMLDVLRELKFETPSEIQEKAIPLAMAGKDIIGGSATGSGKTLAFASPIIEKLRPNGNVQALVLTPTRELAEQVSESIKRFARNKKLGVLAIYGGVSIIEQIRKIPNADIIVGTPGRIIDHLERKTLDLNEVRFLVLDEVDRMFDMGFQRDVEKILFKCPTERQTMLFSATISADIDYLARKHTQNAIEVSVESYVDHSKLKQIYYDVQNNQKFSLFVHLLKQDKSNLVMVFCSTRRNVDFVEKNLNKQGINAVAIHGGLTQNRRSRIMKDFQGGGSHVLVCTDVAARGLDIKGVSHVYNYDLPTSSADYIHRIGRTARAGKEGIAVSLLSNRDYENFGNILRNDLLKIERLELPLFETVEIKASFGGRDFGSRFGGQGRSRGYGRPRREGGSNYGRSRQGGDSRRSGNGYSRPRRESGDGSRQEGGSYNRPRQEGGREGFRGRRGGSGRSGGFSRGRNVRSRDGFRGREGGSRDGFRGSRGGRSSSGSRNSGGNRSRSFSRPRR